MSGPSELGVRLWVLTILVLGLFAGLLGRLCMIQGMDVPRYKALADSQHFAKVLRPERRGTVMDCRGRPLAVSVQVPSIYVNPSLVEGKDRETVARRLAELLGVDREEIYFGLRVPRDVICLKRGLSPEEEQRLRAQPVVRGMGSALAVEGGMVLARPPAIEDPDGVATDLAPLLKRDVEEVRADLEALREFIWVRRKVTEAERKRVVDAPGLTAVGVMPEYKRTYPHGALAAQIVGFVGIEEQGLEGLELALGELLTPKDGYAKFQRDAAGRLISSHDPTVQAAESGLDIELSIDAVIQGYAEAALREAWDLWAPKGAVAVVLDPRTGDLLAAASLPTYDPNKAMEYEPDDFRDRARARYIVDMMEPGSIMKVFVLSAALTEKLVTEETVIFCENGVWVIGSRRFHDHHAYGNLTVAEVIVKSSNVGAAKIGTKVGAERLFHYLRAFGFGRPTGLDLPGENPGMLRPPSRWTSFSLPSVCFGQEVCVNVLQMSLAYGAIANDGLLMRPRLIRRIRRLDGTWVERPPREVGRAIPAAIAQRVRKVLCSVVEQGTGKQARLGPYSVGGKTGTAQKPARGGFSHTALICSFVGMAPADQPRLVVMVSLDEPSKSVGGRHFGGTVAAPYVGQILKQSLAYLGVPPEKPQTLARLGLPVNPEKRTP